MEIIRYEFDNSFELPENFLRLFRDIPFAIVDIETTGLNPSYNKIILIGILYYSSEEVKIEQLFCPSKADENKLLECFVEKIKDIPLLISYNGDAFDIPFINKRLEMNKLEKSPLFCSFDLLRLVRNFQQQFELQDCKLKSIEKFLGIQREDGISGKESVDLYNRYEKSREKLLKDLILLHNHDDLRYLFHSLYIMDKLPHEKLIPHAPSILHWKNGQLCFIKESLIKNNSLYITGFLGHTYSENHVLYKPGYSFHFDSSTQSFIANVPLNKGVLDSGEKCLYIDLNTLPFTYTTYCVNTRLPENIVLLKVGKEANTLEITGLSKELINYVVSDLLTAFSI